MALKNYTDEELLGELENRKLQRALEEEKAELSRPLDFSRMWSPHRNCEWMPMFNSEPDEEETLWIEKRLIPELEKLTQVSWKRDSYLVRTEDNARIFLSTDDSPFSKHNSIVKTLRKRFSTLKDDCFGYKLEKIVGYNDLGDTEVFEYEGRLVISPDRIRRRGELIGEKFGL